MSNAYSLDLRERVVGYVLEGGSRQEATRIFRVGIATLNRWLALQKQTGRLVGKPRTPYKPRKITENTLHEKLREQPDATLKEIGEALNVCDVAVWKACKRFNITRKKHVPA
jgi:putative transposase